MSEPQDMKHWTQGSIDDFTFSVVLDFAAEIEKRLEASEMSRAELADKLKLSRGAVSQILNGRGNITVKTLCRYARVLGMKVAIVVYDDGDSENNLGPIFSGVFARAWEKCKRPRDFFFSVTSRASQMTSPKRSQPKNRPTEKTK